MNQINDDLEESQEELGDPYWIDLRSAEAFASGHLVNSANILAVSIAQRLYELPEKSVSLNLVGEKSDIALAETQLAQKGYQIANRLTVDSDEWLERRNCGQLVKGAQSINLWQPSPIVSYFCKNIAAKSNSPVSSDCSVSSSSNDSPRHGLDIACGSGRDLVYLSMQGWNMHGIDYSMSALNSTQKLADNNGQLVQTNQINLETGYDPLSPNVIEKHSLDLLLVVRYLHRPLFEYFDEWLKPGGYLLYQTFMEGSEKYGSPKNPRFLLKRGELSHVFSQFTICIDKEVTLPDGRPNSFFIAQKAF